MTGRKCEAIKQRLFKNHNGLMGDAIGVSDVKVGKICRNEQTFAVKSIEVLLIEYKIDPLWFFRAEGDEEDEVQFVNDNKLKMKYYETVEKLSTLQEELVGYQKKEIAELKNMDSDE